MSSEPDVKISVQKLGMVAAVVASIIGILGAWVVLPYRVAAAEVRIERMQADQSKMNEVLIRIDENVKSLKEGRVSKAP